MKRMIPGAHGRGYPLKRRTSRVSVLLDIKGEDKKKGKGQKAKVEEVKNEKPKKAVVKKAIKKTPAKVAEKK